MTRHHTQRYEVPASLDGPGIRFHGHREHEIPPHVWQAIRDAAQRVLDNYTRVGTPCGHAPAHEGLNHCAVMICPHVLPRDVHDQITIEDQDEQHTKAHHQDVSLLPGTNENRVLPRQAGARDSSVDGYDQLWLSPGQRHLTRIHPELNIACPRCKASRGFMCVSGGRRSSRTHMARKKTWHSTPVL